MTKSEPSDTLCTDHNPANLSTYDDPCDVNANKHRANDRRDDQPIIPDLTGTTGYCGLRQYRSKLRARKRLCGVTPTPQLPKAGCHPRRASRHSQTTSAKQVRHPPDGTRR